MSHSLHVFDALENSDTWSPAPVTVVAGQEAFLRTLAVSAIVRAVFGEQDIPHETFDGTQVQWRDIADELLYRERQFPFEPKGFCEWGAKPEIKEFRN